MPKVNEKIGKNVYEIHIVKTPTCDMIDNACVREKTSVKKLRVSMYADMQQNMMYRENRHEQRAANGT